MKVVHVCCVAPPEVGGMGAVAYQEVERLRALGIEAILVAPALTPSVIPAKAGIQKEKRNSDGSLTSAPGLLRDDKIVRLPAMRIGNVARLMGLEKVIQDADVVHLHYPFYFTAGLLARWRRQNKIKKLVITLHMDATDKGWRWLAAYLHRKLFQKKILDSADVLLVSTLDYAQSSSFAPWVGTSKLHELPFGVDTEIFRPSVISTEAEHGWSGVEKSLDSQQLLKGSLDYGTKVGASARDDKVFTVGMVGVMDRAHPFKGVDVLLRALAKLPFNVQGVFVGDGDRRADYEELAKELGLKDRVRFLRNLDKTKLIEVFQSMDVFAFPSTSRAEAFGLAMLEAMACGVPVVASDLPGVRSVAKDAGLVVAVNDPEALAEGLRRLLLPEASAEGSGRHTSPLIQRLRVAARDKALRYSWDNHAQKLVEFYSKIPLELTPPNLPLERGGTI